MLRNIGLYRTQRFNEMLRITPGLTKRVLAVRLKELQHGGFIRAVERGRNYTRWGLTQKGEDALPILMTLVHFGSKWYAAEVLADRKARSLSDVFGRAYMQKVLQEVSAAGAPTDRAAVFGQPGAGALFRHELVEQALLCLSQVLHDRRLAQPEGSCDPSGICTPGTS